MAASTVHDGVMTSRTVLIALTAATGLSLAACNLDIDFEETATEQFDLGPFDAVRIDAPFDVTIRQGDTQRVEIEAPESVLDDLVVEVDDGELTIDIDRSMLRIGGGDLIASITVTDLTAIHASGASDVVVPSIDVDTLDLDGGGASSISVSGTIDALDLHLSGASNADMAGTAVSSATVDLSGASSADFGDDVAEIEGDISGASSLDVDRATNVRVDTSGASSIDRN